MRKLLLATRNTGKARELASLLSDVPFQLTTLEDEGIALEVEETGETFEENAVLKARAYAQAGGLLTLADDSGLEVAALEWEPGVRSARYAGDDASDAERVRYLLTKLGEASVSRRFAQFRCVVALAEPGGWVETFEGTCEGEIALSPEGEGGFGYDPIFYLREQGKTMAELSPEEKNALSHRAKATNKAAQRLRRMEHSESGRNG